MDWLFNGSSSSEFNETVEKATSEMIPAGQEDLAMNLDICDRIRGKQVPPREAMRALKKRVQHRNPNVQLLALKLTDICVKNGGSHFLAEIASREFMDALVQIVAQAATNYEVRNKVLALLQSWASAFQSQPTLSYVAETVSSLKNQGYSFPPMEKTNAIMIDTKAAPDWSDSDVCERCRALFTLTHRKHHCRACGKTYCNSCSSRQLALPDLGILQEVRVCQNCYNQRSGTAGQDSTLSLSSSSLPSASISDADQIRLREEAEMQRAIALSLLEADGGKSGRSSAPPSSVKQKGNKKPEVREEEEEDPELAAAIAASLQLAQTASAAAPVTSNSRPKPQVQPPPKESAAATTDPISQQEISSADWERVGVFSRWLEAMDADPTGAASAGLPQDREMRLLYDNMLQLHPHVLRVIETCVEKHKRYMDLHEQLAQAVRTYDRLLEQRLHAASVAAYPQPSAQYPVHPGYPQPPAQAAAYPYPPPQAYQQHAYTPPPPQHQPGPHYAAYPPPPQHQQQQPVMYYGYPGYPAQPPPSTSGQTPPTVSQQQTAVQQAAPAPQPVQPVVESKPLIDFE